MNIIYQLPFPDEICSKIVLYAFKSRHTGLGVAVLKNKLKLKNLDIPEKDEDVIYFNRFITNYPCDTPIDIYYYTCFTNLTEIELDEMGVMGTLCTWLSCRTWFGFALVIRALLGTLCTWLSCRIWPGLISTARVLRATSTISF